MDEHPAPPSPPSASSPSLARGWNTAIIRAVLAAVVLLFLAQAVILLAYFAANDRSKPSAGTVARYGGVVFYTFHHVGFKFDVPSSPRNQGELPFGGVGGVIAFAAMAGTALGLWLLYFGGRAVARQGGGSSLARGLHGLKIAPPYAALTLVGSFFLRFKPEDATRAATIHPSSLAALLWPLALAGVAGFVGGVRSEHPEGWTGLMPEREGLGRRLHGALSGGWRMLVFGLIFAFVGLLVMAVVKPDSTADYFSTFDHGTLDGVLVIVSTLLVLPNMAGWVLFPAMGSCVALSGPLSICFLSYAHFPKTTEATIAGASNPAALKLPSAPPGYFLFLLVPLVAVVFGGMVAARKGRATTRNDAIVLGALAGVVFAILSVLTIFLASITVKITGNIIAFAASGSFRVGPELTSGALWALMWGVVGGALGGWWEGRSLSPQPSPAQPGTPPAPPSDQRDEPS